MRIGIITLFVTVYVSFTRPALGEDQPSAPPSGELRFSDQAALSDIASTLRAFRKTALSSEERYLTRAMLHREKAPVTTADERLLRIELVVFRLGESGTDMVRREVEAIWAAQAVRIEWSPVGTSGCVRVLIDRPASLLPPVARTERWSVAASRVVDGSVLPPIYVSVDAAERVVRAAGPPYSAPALAGIMVPRVLGRAIAHELAHVLLDTRAHARQGLLRASFTANEFVDPGREGFTLNHEQLARARQHELLVTTLQ